jgi:hypothetical protein
VIATNIGKEPNSLLIGRKAYRGLRNNYNLMRRVATGGKTIDLANAKPLSVEQLQEQLDIPNIIVGRGMYNTAKLGATAALSYIWGNYAVLFYGEPTPGRRKVSLAYTFRWNAGSAGQMVQKWYDQDKKRQVIDVMKFYVQQMVAPSAGVLLSNTTQF